MFTLWLYLDYYCVVEGLEESLPDSALCKACIFFLVTETMDVILFVTSLVVTETMH